MKSIYLILNLFKGTITEIFNCKSDMMKTIKTTHWFSLGFTIDLIA